MAAGAWRKDALPGHPTACGAGAREWSGTADKPQNRDKGFRAGGARNWPAGGPVRYGGGTSETEAAADRRSAGIPTRPTRLPRLTDADAVTAEHNAPRPGSEIADRPQSRAGAHRCAASARSAARAQRAAWAIGAP